MAAINSIEEAKKALLSLFSQEQVKGTAVPSGDEQEANAETEPAGLGVYATEFDKRGTVLDITCTAEQVVPVATILDEHGYFIEAIAGVDWIKENCIEVIYDYNRFDTPSCRVVVRVKISRDKPSLPTISHVFSGADWHERETYDFYGVIFEEHPNLERILLPEDADFFPLRKDYMP